MSWVTSELGVGLVWDDLGSIYIAHQHNPQSLAVLATTIKQIRVSPEVTMGGCKLGFCSLEGLRYVVLLCYLILSTYKSLHHIILIT